MPTLEAAKLALHDAMIAANLPNVELAHRLGIDEKAVRRLRDPLYRSHFPRSRPRSTPSAAASSSR